MAASSGGTAREDGPAMTVGCPGEGEGADKSGEEGEEFKEDFGEPTGGGLRVGYGSGEGDDNRSLEGCEGDICEGDICEGEGV